MSFYGNITNTTRTSFTFDQIYPNRLTMDTNKTNDGVYLGRYVLVEYDSALDFGLDCFQCVMYLPYKKNNINLYGYFPAEYVEAQWKNGTKITDDSNHQLWMCQPTVPVTADYVLQYSEVKSSIESGKTYYIVNEGVNPKNDSHYGAYYKSTTGEPAKLDTYDTTSGTAADAAYELETTCTKVFNQTTVGGANIKVYFYFLVLNDDILAQNDPSLIFKEVGNANNYTIDLLSTNYSNNYEIDRTEYGPGQAGIGRGYDSTVWQKAYVNGEIKYIQIAELNTVVPSFGIAADPPSATPVTPHFDADSTNVYYQLHWQPTWGFRVAQANINEEIVTIDGTDHTIKTAVNSDDETFWLKYNPSTVADTGTYQYYEDGEWKNINEQTAEQLSNFVKQHQDTIPAAIYFNKAGFDSLYSVKQDGNNTFTILPSGISGNNYATHERKLSSDQTAIDVQELSVSLPGIGNMIAEGWDLLYGKDTTASTDSSAAALIKGKQDKYAEPLKAYKRFKDTNWKYVGDAPLTSLGGMTRDLSTFAGSLNTFHDLMGMIINYGGPDETNQADIDRADNNLIYYYPELNIYKYKSLVSDIQAINEYIQVVNSTQEEFDSGVYYILNGSTYELATDTYNSTTVYYKHFNPYRYTIVATPEEAEYNAYLYYILDGENYKSANTSAFDSSKTYYTKSVDPQYAELYKEIYLYNYGDPDTNYYYKDKMNYLYPESIYDFEDENKTFYIIDDTDLTKATISDEFNPGKFYYKVENDKYPNGAYIRDDNELPTSGREYYSIDRIESAAIKAPYYKANTYLYAPQYIQTNVTASSFNPDALYILGGLTGLDYVTCRSAGKLTYDPLEVYYSINAQYLSPQQMQAIDAAGEFEPGVYCYLYPDTTLGVTYYKIDNNPYYISGISPIDHESWFPPERYLVSFVMDSGNTIRTIDGQPELYYTGTLVQKSIIIDNQRVLYTVVENLEYAPVSQYVANLYYYRDDAGTYIRSNETNPSHAQYYDLRNKTHLESTLYVPGKYYSKTAKGYTLSYDDLEYRKNANGKYLDRNGDVIDEEEAGWESKKVLAHDYYTIEALTACLRDSSPIKFYKKSVYYANQGDVLPDATDYSTTEWPVKVSRLYYMKDYYYIKDNSLNSNDIGSIWVSSQTSIPNYIELGIMHQHNKMLELTGLNETFDYTDDSKRPYQYIKKSISAADYQASSLYYLTEATSLNNELNALVVTTGDPPAVVVDQTEALRNAKIETLTANERSTYFIYSGEELIQQTTAKYKYDNVYYQMVIDPNATMTANRQYFERRSTDYGAPSTIYGLILRLNKFLNDQDIYSRNTETLQGALNTLNDYIAKLGDTKPGQIMIVDDYARLHSAPYTTEQAHGYTNIGKPNASQTVGNAEEDYWLDLDINTNVAEPEIILTHNFHAAADTTTTADKNGATDAAPGLNNGNGDNLKLYTPIVDNTGHVIGKNIETVELPYGFKKIAAANSTDSNAWAQSGGKTESAGENTKTIVADNTQDTLNLNAGNKWLRIQTFGTNADNNRDSKFNNNQTIELAHETHDVDIAPRTSNLNTDSVESSSDNDKITFQDLVFDTAGHVTENHAHTYTLPYGFKIIVPAVQSTAVTEMTTNTTSIVAENTQDTLTLATDNKWLRIANNATNDTVHFAHKISDLKNSGGTDVATGRDRSTWYGQSIDVDFKTNASTDNTFTIPYIQFDEAGHITGIETHTIKTPEVFEYLEVKGVSTSAADMNQVADVVRADDKDKDHIIFAPGNKWIQMALDGTTVKIAHKVNPITTDAKTATNLNDGTDTIVLQDILKDEGGHITAIQNHQYTLPFGYKFFKDSESVVGTSTASSTQDTFVFRGDTWLKPVVTNDLLTITHSDPNAVALRNLSNVTPAFGDTFIIEDWRFDTKGHKYGVETHTVKIPQGSLTDVNANGADVITQLSFVPSTGALSSTRTNISTLKLTGYNEGTSVDAISADDTLGAAIGKLEKRFDTLMAGAYTDSALDTLKEVQDWIRADETGTAALIGRVSSLETATGTTLPNAIATAKAEAIAAAASDATTKADAAQSAAISTASTDATTKANTAEQNAKDYADSLASNYDDAGSAATAEQNAKDYADGLADNYDVNGAAARVQGDTASTVENVEERVATLEGLQLPSAKDLADGMYVLKKNGTTIEWVSLDAWIGGTY